MYFGILLERKLWSSQEWDTWLNAPATSNESILATFFLLQFQTVCINSTNISSAISVDLSSAAAVKNFLFLLAR